VELDYLSELPYKGTHDNHVIYSSELLNDVWILTGEPVSSQDLSGDCPAVWFSYLHLHGILLSVAWGMLFPTGVLVA